jgi:hypothetical protein
MCISLFQCLNKYQKHLYISIDIIDEVVVYINGGSMVLMMVRKEQKEEVGRKR